MSQDTQTWYIVKCNTGNCEIIPNSQADEENNSEILEKWGPFESQGEALARRVGLIRAGKCQPI
ncbi:DDE transposase family protein [Scytonema sp. NUACC26]|uniref:DDE transposase family protein n=1 Tax=Scytonema sp. NUACC26 TaxID=3140176 RepID=UPI0034DCB87E